MNAQIRTLFSCLFVCAAARAADFYVDAERGRDAQPGTSPEQAWQTLERVNAARLNPGDRVRFKCGQMWRGSLSVQPGAQDAPVTYTSYPGTGERAGWKPRILRSVDLAAPALWQLSGSNIWRAVPTVAGGKNVSEVNGVTYEGNSSYDCGFGWGHAQRPNKNGTHLLAYRLASKALKLHVRNNRFCNSADRMIWFFNPRLNEADCDRNVFWQEGADPEKQPLFAWSGPHAKGTGFGTYRTATGNDTESRFEKIERVPFFDY